MSTHNPSDYESLDSEHTSYTDDDTAFEATSGAELEAADSGHNSDIEIITPDDLTDTSSAFENQPEQTQDEAPQEPQFMPVDITILEKIILLTAQWVKKASCIQPANLSIVLSKIYRPMPRSCPKRIYWYCAA
nr:hypothetical protein [Psychrobacter sp. PraFG1]UNK06637.1 hypothetical protein MN210_12960 [Psychrobacter sp. PraFG1]